MVKVLFVCLGNICRSPMAEAVFRHKVRSRGLEGKIQTDSAGTAGYHIGDPPHNGTLEILKKEGISHEGLKGRKLTAGDIKAFDFIIGMDDNNITDIEAMAKNNSHKVRLLSSFVDAPRWREVPDPWYTGDFAYTYQLINEGCNAVLDTIIKNGMDES